MEGIKQQDKAILHRDARMLLRCNSDCLFSSEGKNLHCTNDLEKLPPK